MRFMAPHIQLLFILVASLATVAAGRTAAAQTIEPVTFYLEVADPQPYYEEGDLIVLRMGVRDNVNDHVRPSGYNVILRTPAGSVVRLSAVGGGDGWANPVIAADSKEPYDEEANQDRWRLTGINGNSFPELPQNPLFATITYMVDEEVGEVGFDLELAFTDGSNENMLGTMENSPDLPEIPFDFETSGAAGLLLGQPAPTPTPSPTPSPTPTATPTPTPSPTPSPTPTPTPRVFTVEEVTAWLLDTAGAPSEAPDRNGDGVVDAADLLP